MAETQETYKYLILKTVRSGLMMHTCNPSTQEAEAGKLQVQSKLGPQNKTLF
jgi:hypothetical protein